MDDAKKEQLKAELDNFSDEDKDILRGFLGVKEDTHPDVNDSIISLQERLKNIETVLQSEIDKPSPEKSGLLDRIADILKQE